MFDDALLRRAEVLVAQARSKGLRIAAAESCTGGLLTALLTEIPGSSAVVERGFVTYSNEAKHEMLAVPSATLALHGAVSAETAMAMAMGVLFNSRAAVAVSITGIAGPGGATAGKPVGLVHFSLATRHGPPRMIERRFGDLGRSMVRQKALSEALGLLQSAVTET